MVFLCTQHCHIPCIVCAYQVGIPSLTYLDVLDNKNVLIFRLGFYINFALLTYRKSVDMLALTLVLFLQHLKSFTYYKCYLAPSCWDIVHNIWGICDLGHHDYKLPYYCSWCSHRKLASWGGSCFSTEEKDVTQLIQKALKASYRELMLNTKWKTP